MSTPEASGNAPKVYNAPAAVQAAVPPADAPSSTAQTTLSNSTPVETPALPVEANQVNRNVVPATPAAAAAPAETPIRNSANAPETPVANAPATLVANAPPSATPAANAPPSATPAANAPLPATPNSNSAQAQAQAQAQTQAQAPSPAKHTPFFYTQSKFWGGATVSYPIYAALAFVGGLVGLDHLYLRSPTTALLKTVVNVCTLGFWWFYDIIQVVTESDSIKAHGIAMPFYGPSGIAAGSFLKDGEENTNASPFAFMAFAIAVCVLPYGLDYLIAGDTKGAVMKMLSTFWLFGILYGIINIYKLFMYPDELLCQGTHRYAPFTFIGLNSNYNKASFVNKNAETCATYPTQQSSLLEWFKGSLNSLKFLKSIPVVGKVVGTAEAVVDTATQTVTTAAGVASKLVEKGGEAAVAFADAAVDGAKVLGEVSKVPGKLQALPARAAAVSQTGGGAKDEPEHTLVSLVFALIFIGAAFLKGKDALIKVIQRTRERPPALGTVLWRKQNVDDRPPAPPEPGVF